TGANLVVSGAPAYPINNAGAYTVFDLATLGACTANQALTKNANGSFACAQVSSLAATIPTCAAGYFLTFDGTAFSCANGASAASTVTSSAVLAALPQCSSGQTLLSNGNGGWSCGSPPPAAGNMISIPYNGQTYTVPAYVICPVNIGGNTVGVIAPLYFGEEQATSSAGGTFPFIATYSGSGAVSGINAGVSYDGNGNMVQADTKTCPASIPVQVQ